MSEVTPRDREWMAEALTLARRGHIGTAPNPRVGCVLVRGGQVLSSGWHAAVGGPHAEAAALQALPTGEDAHGATAYVTLEPCSHHGRTPPCSEALIASGIERCVVGMVDPNPKVAGSGIDRMRAAGIEVGPSEDLQALMIRKRRSVSPTPDEEPEEDAEEKKKQQMMMRRFYRNRHATFMKALLEKK